MFWGSHPLPLGETVIVVHALISGNAQGTWAESFSMLSMTNIIQNLDNHDKHVLSIMPQNWDKWKHPCETSTIK